MKENILWTLVQQTIALFIGGVHIDNALSFHRNCNNILKYELKFSTANYQLPFILIILFFIYFVYLSAVQ
jgi:hypothetical protein